MYHLLQWLNCILIVQDGQEPDNRLSFLLVVALKRTHKLRSKPFAEHYYAVEESLLHFASADRRTVSKEHQFVYLLAQLSVRLKLHNIPSIILEQPGVSFFHQEMSFSEALRGSVTVLSQHTYRTIICSNEKTPLASLLAVLGVLAILVEHHYAAHYSRLCPL